jgi:hypothetical protein
MESLQYRLRNYFGTGKCPDLSRAIIYIRKFLYLMYKSNVSEEREIIHDGLSVAICFLILN